MKSLLVFLVICCIQHLSIAQNDYIIDINDRKIYGKVILSTPAINSSQISFKDQSGTVKKYRPDEIKEWSIGNATYQTKFYAINERKGYSVFMLRLTPPTGKCHLYEYYNTSGDMGYTQTFLEKDRALTEVDYPRFRKQLAEYFKENKELAEDIANKKYKKKDLLKIIEVYNEWREFLWK
ncbi:MULTISPECIES: hypothetical protein [unclassified Aureispira]|uniref:hypothetical protein n=1 Tax=unclassified Aureispira TaxID=2649989 RepID=UPI0006987D28|nr:MULTISPECIES: hypothetical protein [unclassified Aureispira]WMX14576.1 hypothetical protein QP953_27340 [Aureispira sp. CCB-E]